MQGGAFDDPWMCLAFGALAANIIIAGATNNYNLKIQLICLMFPLYVTFTTLAQLQIYK